jgi:hypothetical protein
MSPTSSPINEQATLSNGGRTVTLRLPHSPAAPSESGKEIVLSPERFQQLRTFLVRYIITLPCMCSGIDWDVSSCRSRISTSTSTSRETSSSAVNSLNTPSIRSSRVMLLFRIDFATTLKFCLCCKERLMNGRGKLSWQLFCCRNISLLAGRGCGHYRHRPLLNFVATRSRTRRLCL